jgi:hypothetical protein
MVPRQKVKRVILVGSLKSFFEITVPNTLVVYLGGYHNELRRNILVKIYDAIPDAKYSYFGDIDAASFQLFYHLSEKTGIPFEPFGMDKKTLVKYAKSTKPLDSNEEIRLERLKNRSTFNEVIDYMLEHSIKLAHEIIVDGGV